MTIKDLEPKSVWTAFYELSQVPRPSKHEEKAQQFLLDWGKEHGVSVRKDETGNIIFTKPATPGYENRRGVILQAHVDMVPQKTADTVHDFLKDPIQTQIDGEWVTAKGTTLGADDGIGVSLALAALEDKTLKHGPIEVLITYDEETGMTGAENLKPGELEGDILLNLDSEAEGELYIGCAGGLDGMADFPYKTVKAGDGYVSYKLTIKGLEGGHSGQDIVLYRANANKIAVRILLPLLEKYGVKVADFTGGSLRNAIPFEADVAMLVPVENEAAVKTEVEKIFAIAKDEFADTDPSAQCYFEKQAEPYTSYIEDDVMLKAVKAIYACPSSVERMSPSMPGLVETSVNMAVVRTEDGHLTVRSLIRSSVDSAKEDLAEKMRCVFELAGASFATFGGYPGWTPVPTSPVIGLLNDVYHKLFGKDMKVMAIHAGLECALLGAKYPNWDMVSLGPTLLHPHSPDERVKIDTVDKCWKFLVALLEAIPVKA